MKLAKVKEVPVTQSASTAVAQKHIPKSKLNLFSRNNLLTLLKYALIAIGLLALSNASLYEVRPFGASFYFALLFLNVPFVIITPMFLASELVAGGIFGLFSAAIQSVLFFGAKKLFDILKTKKVRNRWILYTAPPLSTFAVAAFMAFTQLGLLHLLLHAFLSLAFSAAARIALRPILIEKLKYKMLETEIICLAVLVAAASVGFSAFRLMGFPLALMVAAYTVFIAARAAGGAKAIVVGLTFGVGHSLYANEVTPMAAYAFIAIVAAAFAAAPKIIMPLSSLAGYLIFRFFFFYETTYLIHWLLALSVAGIAYMFTPNHAIKTLKNYLFETHDKTAVRYMMQRDREDLAHRLRASSGVFCAMSQTLSATHKTLPEYHGSLANKCCALCEHQSVCAAEVTKRAQALDSMMQTVVTKGKAQLSDIPDYLTSRCANLAKLLNTATQISDARNVLKVQIENENKSRSVISHQMLGLSGVLDDLAATTSASVKTEQERERILVQELNYASVATAQSLIVGDTVTLVLRTETFDRKAIERLVSRVTNRPFTIYSIDDTTLSGFCCVLLKARPIFDVVFGVAGVAKKVGDVSGDSHSFIKIGRNRFMMALSDGMGSGKKAHATSSAAIGLVENFYRAGFSGELVLKSVNRFLAGTGGENFSSLDICVIDLDNLDTDVVKLATPATYIKRQDSVEKIEGSGAPMGMLDTIEPKVQREQLQSGDMLVLASDGVEECFSGDKLSATINNLRTLNPQTLAESILEHAMHLNGGVLKDDSTVLVARVIPV